MSGWLSRKSVFGLKVRSWIGLVVCLALAAWLGLDLVWRESLSGLDRLGAAVLLTGALAAAVAIPWEEPHPAADRGQASVAESRVGLIVRWGFFAASFIVLLISQRSPWGWVLLAMAGWAEAIAERMWRVGESRLLLPGRGR